jgi:dihydrofolate synthase/folylpolyglutamate synthase
MVLVDVGHNPMAAGAVAEVIENKMADRPGGRCVCVLAMLADKDASAVARILDPLVSAWYCAGLQGERGQTGAEVAAQVGAETGRARLNVCEDVEQAIEQALEDCGLQDCILVFGSFHTAGAALARWPQG